MISNLFTRPPAIYRYGRASTGEQVDTQVAQRQRTYDFMEYAQKSGRIPAEAVDAGFYCDVVSGNTPVAKRKQGSVMMERIQPGDYLIVTKPDRLCRNLADIGQLVEMCLKRGIGLHFIDLDVNIDSAMGRCILNILTSIAQWEREMNAERQIERRQALKAITGHDPVANYFGWKKMGKGENIRFVVYEAQRWWGDLFCELFMEGYSINSIEQNMTCMGINKPMFTKAKSTTWPYYYVWNAVASAYLGYPQLEASQRNMASSRMASMIPQKECNRNQNAAGMPDRELRNMLKSRTCNGIKFDGGEQHRAHVQKRMECPIHAKHRDALIEEYREFLQGETGRV